MITAQELRDMYSDEGRKAYVLEGLKYDIERIDNELKRIAIQFPSPCSYTHCDAFYDGEDLLVLETYYRSLGFSVARHKYMQRNGFTLELSW